MLEAPVLWNKPDNLSNWNFYRDPDRPWFSEVAQHASAATRSDIQTDYPRHLIEPAYEDGPCAS